MADNADLPLYPEKERYLTVLLGIVAIWSMQYYDRDHMKDFFFIPFPKPKRNLKKCQR